MINQGIFDLKLVNLAFGTSQTLDTSDYRVEFMVVSVQTGILDLWFGANALGIRHTRFRANEPVSWLPIALCGDRFVVTVQGQDIEQGITSATLIFVSGKRAHFDG